MTDDAPQIAVLTGPTSVGKTEVAVDVAERLGAEIVSLDSMAVYRRLDIATAKPSAEQRARVPHHLIDIVDPREPFSVAEYLAAAEPLARRLLAAGTPPLFVGGTLYYYRALTRPFSSACPPDPELRQRLSELPPEELRARLEAIDPATAARLHSGDRKRCIRALEVHEKTGRSLSAWQEESRNQSPLFRARTVALIREREELYARVNARCDAMVAAGLVDEVRGLLDAGFDESTLAMQGHGYDEIIPAARGETPLAEAVELMKRNTRRYVKYQLQWLRRMPEVRFVRADQPHARVVEECVALLA